MRPGRSSLPPAPRPAGDVSRRSLSVVLNAHESGPLGLPSLRVDLPAGQPAVEDLQRRLTGGSGRPAAAAGQQPPHQPHDQPEQDEPEHAHTKPSERTHSAAIPTHHGELLLRQRYSSANVTAAV